MDRQQISLKLTLDALGLPVRVDTFENRLILQKAVYLSQSAGVQLGYHYHWYLRGPYSPSLTRDAFAVVAELKESLDDSLGRNLDSASLQRLAKVRKFIDNTPENERPTRLELVASVGFLLKTPASHGQDVAELQATLQRFGKPYTPEQVRHAIEELKHYGIGPGVSSR